MSKSKAGSGDQSGGQVTPSFSWSRGFSIPSPTETQRFRAMGTVLETRGPKHNGSVERMKRCPICSVKLAEAVDVAHNGAQLEETFRNIDAIESVGFALVGEGR